MLDARQAISEFNMTTLADSPLRAAVRAMVPKPVRATYWQLRRAVDMHRIRSGRSYERPVAAAIKANLRRGDVALDVGANVGLLTLLMAHRVGPSGQVHAFEPHPDNAARLERDLQIERLTKRVSVVRAAVNDGSVKEISLFAGRGHATSEWNIMGHDVNGVPTEAVLKVPTVSLDEHFAPGSRIDLVKIDVEGAESLVLAGMQRVLDECAPVLMIECHSAENWSACTRLTERGYTLHDLQGQRLDPAGAFRTAHFVATPASRTIKR